MNHVAILGPLVDYRHSSRRPMHIVEVSISMGIGPHDYDNHLPAKAHRERGANGILCSSKYLSRSLTGALANLGSS